jgi:hypothetical protein
MSASGLRSFHTAKARGDINDIAFDVRDWGQSGQAQQAQK